MSLSNYFPNKIVVGTVYRTKMFKISIFYLNNSPTNIKQTKRSTIFNFSCFTISIKLAGIVDI